MRSSRQVHKRARRRKENSVSNGTKDEEPDVIVIEPSSSDSPQPILSNNSAESDDDDDEEPNTSSNNVAAADDDEEEEEEEEEGEEDEGEEREREELKRENHRKKKKRKENAAAEEEEERENLLHKFPMNRINKIVRSASDDYLRLTHEAVFLINKASEKFLDLFCEEAYDCTVQDHKNYVAYKNLSSIVCKQRRFDFLSDFIPEKLKIEDALEERKAAGT